MAQGEASRWQRSRLCPQPSAPWLTLTPRERSQREYERDQFERESAAWACRELAELEADPVQERIQAAVFDELIWREREERELSQVVAAERAQVAKAKQKGNFFGRDNLPRRHGLQVIGRARVRGLRSFAVGPGYTLKPREALLVIQGP